MTLKVTGTSPVSCDRAPIDSHANATLADPKLKARFADLGGTVLAGSPSDFGKLIAEETDKWGQGNPGRQYQGGVRRASIP
jgi:hypothetical protein